MAAIFNLNLNRNGSPTYTPFAFGPAGLPLNQYFGKGPMAFPKLITQAPAQPIVPARVALVATPAPAQPIAPGQVVEAPQEAAPTVAQPTKNLFQTVTQPKVLIATGVALTAIGIGVAAYMFPATATAYAATIGNASQAAVVHTGNFLQPGIAAHAIFFDLAFKTVILPGVKISVPVLLPVISTAVVATIGIIAISYIAMKIFQYYQNMASNIGASALHAASNLPGAGIVTTVGRGAMAAGQFTLDVLVPDLEADEVVATPPAPLADEEQPPALEADVAPVQQQATGPGRKPKAPSTWTAFAIRAGFFGTLLGLSTYYASQIAKESADF